jgi:hypothetical protein
MRLKNQQQLANHGKDLHTRPIKKLAIQQWIAILQGSRYLRDPSRDEAAEILDQPRTWVIKSCRDGYLCHKA